MTKIESFFNGVRSFAGDIWVADYTNKTNHLPKGQRVGVVIQDREPEDIKSFHLQNMNGIEVLAVNFEQNKGFFPDGVRDCECFFRPKDVGKGWVLLCELKYCKEENIAVNASSAYEQLMDTWRLLDGKGFYDRRHCKVFFNISIPEHNFSIAPPFEGFIGNQDERIEFRKRHKIHLFGVNNILAINAGILQAVASPV